MSVDLIDTNVIIQLSVAFLVLSCSVFFINFYYLSLREMSSENALDLQYVHDSFQKSLKDDDDVIVDPYIEGYNELVK